MNDFLCLFQRKHHLTVLSLNASLSSPTNSANYFFSVVCGSWQSKQSVKYLSCYCSHIKKKGLIITAAMFWVLKTDVITNFQSPYNHNLLSHLPPDSLGPVKRASQIIGTVFKVISENQLYNFAKIARWELLVSFPSSPDCRV